jgi:phage FluMu protein Com
MPKATRLQTVRCECGGVLEVAQGPKLQGSPVLRCTQCGRLFVAQIVQPSYCDTGSDIPGGGAS